MNSGISVAMCTYNGARFIEEQLRSITNQSLLPDEIVISDDGSTDGTVQIIERLWSFLIAERPTVAHIKLEILQNDKPLGVVSNFSQALNRCNSEFIALCDQDDIWNTDKLKIMLAYFDRDPQLLLLHTDARLVDKMGSSMGISAFQALRLSQRIKDRVHSGNAMQELVKRNIVTGATVLIRRQILKSALPIPESWLHDEWLAIVASCTGRLDFVDLELIQYRQHGGNEVGMQKLGIKHMIGRVIHPGRERNERLYSRAKDLFEHKFNSEIDEKFQQMISRKFIHESARIDFHKNRFRRFPQVINEVLTGRYSSCGLGLQDIFRDMFQPL